MKRPFTLSFYFLISDKLSSLANRKLEKRLKAGKEDANRINERRGGSNTNRPQGELIWFHAASVGESLSLLGLVEEILEERPLANILITTGTTTSANLIQTRMPDRTIHQYIPIDIRQFVIRFLDHWKPDIAIFTESELWPCLISYTFESKIPLILVNARISQKSFSNWKWFKRTAYFILKSFSVILCQDEKTANYIKLLSNQKINPQVTGSLKQSAPPLPFIEEERTKVCNQIGSRPVWLAASTHEDEELIIADAHTQAKRFSRRLLLIIAPRHPNRGKQIFSDFQKLGWQVSLRSAGDEIDTNTDIYIADTFGEMGLWFRICPISFMGGSLVKIGGHNPFEPAALGSAILHGPHVWSAVEAYNALGKSKASLQVQNSEELSQAVIDLLNPDTAASMAHSAWETCSKDSEASSRALNEILNVLDKSGLSQ